MSAFVTTPLININDETMTLVEWLKPDRGRVAAGESIALVETSKSVEEIEAEADGFLAHIAEAGAVIAVGQVIAALLDSPDDEVPLPGVDDVPTGEALPAAEPGPTWTKKAELIARDAGVDMGEIVALVAPGERITESTIRRLLATHAAASSGAPETSAELEVPSPDRPILNRIERVLILGGGLGAVQTLDVIARTRTQRAVAILDDDPKLHGSSIMGVPVLGGMGQIGALLSDGLMDTAVISISSNLSARVEIFERATAAGLAFANVVDPTTLVGSHVQMGVGNLIMGLSRLGAYSTLGDNNFLSAYVNIEHHSTVGSHCTFGPAVFTSSLVTIGDRVRFGAGVSIEPRVEIGSDATVASGVTLTTHVPAGGRALARGQASVRDR